MPLVKFNRVPAAADNAEPKLAASIAELQSSDSQVRRKAAHLLGGHSEAADVLCVAVAREPDQSVRESIFTALMRIGTKPAAAGLMPLLQSEDVGLRNGAIEALKTMPEPAAQCIDESLASSADIRLFGVEILAALAYPDTGRRLIRVVEEDCELNVCAAAVDGLAACGDRAAVGPLLALLERFPNEPFLEFSVRSALAQIAAADECPNVADSANP